MYRVRGTCTVQIREKKNMKKSTNVQGGQTDSKISFINKQSFFEFFKF